VTRTRLVPLALAVTALLAVVAIAAHGRPLGSTGGHGGALPLSFWDYVYTTGVILFVPLFLAGLFAAAFIRRRKGKRRNTLGGVLGSVILWSLCVALYILAVRHLKLHRLPQSPESGLLKGGQHGAHQHTAVSHSLQFRWSELFILLGFLVLAAVVIAARVYRQSAETKTSSEAAPEALAAALDESLDDLRTDPDLRRAIIAAYARMETALAAAGVPRHPSEAPLEYVERTLLSLDTSAEAVRKLTDLFEWARFSQHEPEPSMRDDAVEALVAVRDELRASELAPA
jgi:hypothetical protein